MIPPVEGELGDALKVFFAVGISLLHKGSESFGGL